MSVTSSVNIAKPYSIILLIVFPLITSPIIIIIFLSIGSEWVEKDVISFTPSSFNEVGKNLLSRLAIFSFAVQYKVLKTAK